MKVFSRFGDYEGISRLRSWKQLITKLEYLLVNEGSEVRCKLSGALISLNKEELVSLAPCKHVLSPGVWSLQVSLHQRTLAAAYFYLVGDIKTERNLPFHSVQESCENSTNLVFQPCQLTDWSTLSSDDKSSFLEN